MYRSDLGRGTTTAIKVSGRLRVQTTYEVSGVEMVEEWSSPTSLLSRRWRETSTLGKDGEWEWEIGVRPPARVEAGGEIKASDVNPQFIGRDSEDKFVWHVTRCPWPEDNYSVSYDGERDELVLRTGNRKYYKRWRVPTLVRMGLGGEGLEVGLRWMGDGEDLVVIEVEKNDGVKEEERRRRKEREKAAEGMEGGGGDCKQS